MPYFVWRGVDIVGTIKKGKTFARSQDHLDTLLFKRHIALMNAQQQKDRAVHLPISLLHQAAFFRQLSVLTGAGVLLPDALTIVSEQIANRELQEIVHRISLSVQEGVSFGNALAEYPKLFDAITIQLVKAGEDAGNLADALDALCNRLQTAHDFYARLRAALLLPLLTIAFFLVIALIIFIVVIPRFQDLFKSLGAQIPSFTKFLLNVSLFIRSWYFPAAILLLIVCCTLTWMLQRKHSAWWVGLVLQLPFVGTIYKTRFVGYWLQALSLLLHGGTRLVPALAIVKSSVRNPLFVEYISLVEQEVQSGHSLSEAMQAHCDDLCSPDIIAMVQVGEESGRLPFMLSRAADVYHQRIRKALNYITVLAQPILMVLLGLMVTVLVFSIYIPILHISQVAP